MYWQKPLPDRDHGSCHICTPQIIGDGFSSAFPPTLAIDWCGDGAECVVDEKPNVVIVKKRKSTSS
jgi:hypothetical protein